MVSDIGPMGRIIQLGELAMNKICLTMDILAASEIADFTSLIKEDLKGQNLE